mgnify:FL=1|tara:strand:- start:62120 stop:62839 length:720 start_codon:yes stop_codon:yes gene_type:complete
MVILTTLYNAEKYIERCIGSIMGQTYINFKCYITDDISTDNSANLVRAMINGDDRFILIENTSKMYQPGNYDQVIRNNESILDDDICIEVDGDDWLPDSKTLERINNIYEDKNIWIANGSFKYSNGRPGFAAPPRNIDTIRQEVFTASHVRTWRAFLWRAIEEDYLKDENGQYWKVAGDLAFMYPMIEMSGPEHYRFMTDINYVYNEENPLNDHKVNMSSVNEIVVKIRNREQYKRLIR